MAGRKPGTGRPAVYQAAACRAALARDPSGRQVEQQYVGDRVVRDALHVQFARLVHVTDRIARRQRATVDFGGSLGQVQPVAAVRLQRERGRLALAQAHASTEERRVGKEWGSTCRTRGVPVEKKKKKKTKRK